MSNIEERVKKIVAEQLGVKLEEENVSTDKSSSSFASSSFRYLLGSDIISKRVCLSLLLKRKLINFFDKFGNS